MPKIRILVEVEVEAPEAFSAHMEAAFSATEAFRQNEQVARKLSGTGLEIAGDYAPVPLFSSESVLGTESVPGFRAFAAPTLNPDVSAATVVLSAEVEKDRLEALKSRPGVRVFPNSPLTLFPWSGYGAEAMQAAVDCRPFQPAVPAAVIRDALGVQTIFDWGFRGQGVAVAILDEGINGDVYPVSGGFSRPSALQPGQAQITSHGSMCAADVLVAAPGAALYDYPFLGIPDSGGALGMLQAILEQRRRDGTPHLATNSYGFVGVPPRESNPNHEIYDLNHPLHRKIRELIASGMSVFFAAGNCGSPCPSGKCLASGIGPGRSIHASNSLAEVITVAAVNSAGVRIGYSSQGPGMFYASKPDIAAYSHFFGNFGPGRPGGVASSPFDNGTSAACPVAAGVGALLLSVFGPVSPELLKSALIESAWNPDGGPWNPDTGHGILHALAAYASLYEKVAPQMPGGSPKDAQQ